MSRTSLTVLTDRGNDPGQTSAENFKKFVETVGTEVFKGEEDSDNLAPNVFSMWGTRPDDPAAKSAVLQLMEGSHDSSNVVGVVAPQITLGELRRVGR